MPFVLDSSVAMAWVLPDEANPTLDPLCDRLTHEVAVVPPVWPLEIANVLLVAVKRGRLTAKDVRHLVTEIRALPLEIDSISTERVFDETLALAQKYHLTTYDASYLELAKRRGIPLATLDARLRQACLSAKVTFLPA
ncbi:MAG: type II toxin-antitoxin system VapC family toxin [Nitrospirales bacterium]|nr:type II toxin-antitoxin system VapC family toxin [Nitrospirales bacterium]